MWASRIRHMMNVPPDLSNATFRGKWNGVYKHTGADSYTPLKRSLAGKHTSGLYTILAGTLLWMGGRLEGKADIGVLDELAEALFLYQQSPLYFASSELRPRQDEIDGADRFHGPILFVRDEWFDHRLRSLETWSVYPPHNMIGKFLELTRYVVGSDTKEIFDLWIREAISRMNHLVPFPGHFSLPSSFPPEQRAALARTTMGPPLPPHVLDLSRARMDAPR